MIVAMCLERLLKHSKNCCFRLLVLPVGRSQNARRWGMETAGKTILPQVGREATVAIASLPTLMALQRCASLLASRGCVDSYDLLHYRRLRLLNNSPAPTAIRARLAGSGMTPLAMMFSIADLLSTSL